MRKPPPPTECPHYPIVTGTAALAIGVTLAWWGKVDVSPLLEDAHLRTGELWRLLTSILPHVSVYHLVFNVYWLWVFGTLLEREWGHARTLGLIILFAAGSGAAEYTFLEGGVGLSGVGYGLFGLLWVLSRKDGRFSDAADQQTTSLFFGWFVLCIILTITDVWRIANIAHGVGALLGVMVGVAATARPRVKPFAWAATVATVLSCIVAAIFLRPYVNFSRVAAMDEERMGYAALTGDRNTEAVRWLKDATRMNPHEARTWYNLAIAYDRTGDTAAATRAFGKAAAIAPEAT